MGIGAPLLFGIAATCVLPNSATAQAYDAERRTRLLLPFINEFTAEESIAGAKELCEYFSSSSRGFLCGAPAAALIEQRISRPRSAATPEQTAELADCVSKLEEYVALRRRTQALIQIERYRRLVAAAPDLLYTDRDFADLALLGCLATARFFHENHDATRARAEVLQCRGSMPYIRVQPGTQPPSVFAILNDVDAEIATRPTHNLTVRTQGEALCTASVDGRRLSSVPGTMNGVPEGEHWVDLECTAEPSAQRQFRPTFQTRSQRVAVGTNDQVATVDLAFDQALRTDRGNLALIFPDRTDIYTQKRVEWARILASATGAAEIWFVEVWGGQILIKVFDATTNAPACSIELDRSDRTQFEPAFEAIQAQRSVRISNGAPIERWRTPEELAVIDAAVEAQRIALRRTFLASRRRTDPVPWIILAGGALLSVGGYASAAWHYDIGQRGLSEDSSYSNTAALAYSLGLVGNVVITATVPALLPGENGAIPAWSYVLGAAGAGAIVGGSVLISMDGECQQTTAGRCLPRNAIFGTAPLGALVLSSGAPLLAVPITHALRAAFHLDTPRVAASASITPESGTLFFYGAF